MRSIRTRLIFWTALLFIFIGGLIYIPLSNILPRRITAHILKRDVRIAEYIAQQAKENLLLNDTLALSLLLHENLDKLGDAQYLFISGADGNIVSHTFRKGFPQALLPLNHGAQYSHRIRELISGDKRIYDISAPILNGELGNLHLGVSLDSSKAEIAGFTKLNYYVAVIIIIGLGIGILIFTLLGLFLSRNIIKLKEFATKIGSGDLSGNIDIRTNDEIGSLAASFNEMAAHLREKIEKIKKLSFLEERDRIAVEFHDGLAQDLANIIQRLGLAERLFKIDPPRAIEELDKLRDTTKDILNKTRQLIFDLKSPADREFNLLANLNNYVKDYQLESAINVELNISGPIDEIPLEKAKSVFYIIREALINVKKHSSAENVGLDLGFDNNEIAVTIKDDGKGFDIDDGRELFKPDEGKWGLIGMRQRASALKGILTVNSEPNQGTRICVKVPIR